jgi:septal ring factor EnvC (AmiA/AmiB activator)
MDWPGAKELSDRLQRMVPPELLQTDETPEMQRAQQQIEQLQQQLQQAMAILEKVPASFEAQKLKVDEYNAETKRIAATKEGLTPEQLFDTVEGVLAADKQFSQQPSPAALPRQMG